MGGYDRIYPLEANADEGLQDKYNDILKAVYNYEAELQLRKMKREQDAR